MESEFEKKEKGRGTSDGDREFVAAGRRRRSSSGDRMVATSSMDSFGDGDVDVNVAAIRVDGQADGVDVDVDGDGAKTASIYQSQEGHEDVLELRKQALPKKKLDSINEDASWIANNTLEKKKDKPRDDSKLMPMWLRTTWVIIVQVMVYYHSMLPAQGRDEEETSGMMSEFDHYGGDMQDGWKSRGWFDLRYMPFDDEEYVRGMSVMIHDLQGVVTQIFVPALFVVLGWKAALVLRRIYGWPHKPSRPNPPSSTSVQVSDSRSATTKSLASYIRYKLTRKFVRFVIAYLSTVLVMGFIVFVLFPHLTTRSPSRWSSPEEQDNHGLMMFHVMGASKTKLMDYLSVPSMASLESILRKHNPLPLENVPINWRHYVMILATSHVWFFAFYAPMMFFAMLPYCYTLWTMRKSHSGAAEMNYQAKGVTILGWVLSGWSMIVAPLIWLFTIFDAIEATIILVILFLSFLRYNAVSQSFRRGFTTCCFAEHRIFVAFATLLPTLILALANVYFEGSKRANLGIALLFVSPLILSIIPIPPTILIHIPLSPNAVLITFQRTFSFLFGRSRESLGSHTGNANSNSSPTSNPRRASSHPSGQWTTFHIHSAYMRPALIFLGFILFIAQPKDLIPSKLPSPTLFFNGALTLDRKTSNTFAQFFFTFVCHATGFLIGFNIRMYLDQQPVFMYNGNPQNLFSCVMAILALLSFMPPVPPILQSVSLFGGYTSYLGQFERVLSVLSCGWWALIGLLVVCLGGNVPIQYVAEQFFYDAQNVVLFVHPIFVHLFGFAMNAGLFGKITWSWKVYLLYALVWIASHVAAYVHLRWIAGRKTARAPILPGGR